MELFTLYMTKGKKSERRRVGRPSRADLGMEALVSITTKVEQSVVDALRKKHGTIAAAMRYYAQAEGPSQS